MRKIGWAGTLEAARLPRCGLQVGARAGAGSLAPPARRRSRIARARRMARAARIVCRSRPGMAMR
jgi:hypothetical protein